VNSPNNSYYGETKYLSELEVWRGAEEGLSTVILNPSVVLGIGDWTKSSTKIFKYVWDQHKYYPGGSFNYVDSRDVADAVIQLLNSDIEGMRFILSNGKISYKEFFERIAKEFGKKPPYKLASYRLSKMILIVEKIRSLLSGKLPMVTKETLLMSKENFEYENSKIKKTIGFEFRNLDNTVKWACAGLKK
jgi:nucleoside-diphosphate-sugar epimerase